MRIRFKACLCLLVVASIGVAGLGRAVADSPPAAQPPATPKQDSATPPKPPEKGSPDANSAAGTPAVVVDDNSVESLLGRDVKSASGEKLGQITDILVSHAGDIRAAVIDFGGFLGVGSRKIAVAWPTLHFSPSSITLEMTRDELRVTPEYHQGEPIVIVGAAAASSQPSQSQAAPKTPAPPQPPTTVK